MTFQDILNTIRKKYGENTQSIFEEKIKINLNIFAGGEHKEKINLLFKAIDIGYFDRLYKSSEPQKTIRILIQDFQDNHRVTDEEAIETISYLATLLGQKMPEMKAPPLKPELQPTNEVEIRIKELEKNILILQNNFKLQTDNHRREIESDFAERLSKFEKYIKNIIVNQNTIINEKFVLFDSRLKPFEEIIVKLQEKIETVPSNRDFNEKQEEITTKFETLKRQIQILSEKIDSITNRLDNMDSRIKIPDNNSNKLETIKKSETARPEKSGDPLHTVTASIDRIVSEFNIWASEPNNQLPTRFYYLENNDMRIRSAQPLTASASETKWISNRNDSKKYLFPNPNLLTPNTDISEFYKMDMAKLGKKGQNRIKITNPCEMSNTGYINYSGELILL
jgi:methyl-accepting chemotaxis protein